MFLKQYLKVIFVWLLFLPIGHANVEVFDRSVEDLIYEKIDNNRIVVELQFESKDKIDRIKSRQQDIKTILLVNFDPRYSSFKVRVDYNNGISDEVVGRYNTFMELPVPARFIKAGEIITPSDLARAKTRVNRIKDNYIVSEEGIVGMQAKKHLSPGVLVKSNELIRPPVIKINDPVNIIYLSNNLKLKTSGIALGNGAIGDSIKVKNEDSGTTLLGQIINKNTVQVGFDQ